MEREKEGEREGESENDMKGKEREEKMAKTTARVRTIRKLKRGEKKQN